MNQDFEEKQPKQPGFFWLFEWLDNAEKFNDHQLADFVRAMVASAKGEPYELQDDPLVELAFKYADRDRQRMDYQRVVKSNNGKNGGAPKGNKNAQKQPKTTEKQPKTTENKLKDKDNDKYIDKVNDNIPPLSGGIDAPPREMGLESYGILHNVMLSAQQHRTLSETFGQSETDTAIDELSCKLADGTFDSRNHYATLHYWLSYRINTGKAPAPNDHESELRQVWNAISDKDRQEYLDTHDGLTPWQYEKEHGTN